MVNTVQCTDDLLQTCALETYIILLTRITPINLIKNKNQLFQLAKLLFFYHVVRLYDQCPEVT